MNSRMVSADLTPKHDAAIIVSFRHLIRYVLFWADLGLAKVQFAGVYATRLVFCPHRNPKLIPGHVLWVVINEFL